MTEQHISMVLVLCDGEMNMERIAKCLPNPEPKTQTIQFLRMLMPLKSLLLQKHIVWQWYPRHYISKCCDTEMRKHQASPSRTCEKNARNRREAMCNGHTNRINLINDIDFSVGNGKQPKNT